MTRTRNSATYFAIGMALGKRASQKESALEKTLETGGTWGHSSVVGGNSYFITSADSPNNFAIWLATEGIGNKEVKGYWQGEPERAWVINMADLKKVYGSGWINTQECILVLGPCDARDRRPASLHGVAKRTWCIECGHLYSTTREIAMGKDGYMFDPTSGEYFLTTEAPTPEVMEAMKGKQRLSVLAAI